MVKKGIENIVKLRLANQLRKAKRPVWTRVREILLQPKRREVEVNLYKLDQVTAANDVVVVPGKVLGIGKLTHPLTLAYVDASQTALASLKESKSNAVPLASFLEKNAGAKNVKIVI